MQFLQDLILILRMYRFATVTVKKVNTEDVFGGVRNQVAFNRVSHEAIQRKFVSENTLNPDVIYMVVALASYRNGNE